MKRIVRRNPFLVYVLAGLVINLVGGLASAQYDDRGLGGALFALGLLFGAMSWAISELLFSMNAGRAFPGMDALATTLSIAAALLLDHLIRRWARRRSSIRDPLCRREDVP